MTAGSFASPLAEAFRGRQFRATIILLVSPLLMITWRIFGDPKLLQNVPAALVLWGDRQATGAVYSFVACFVLLGLVPAVVVKLVFGQSLGAYGVAIGNWKRTFRSMVILVPLFIAGGWVAAQDPGVKAQYPVNPHAGASPPMFAWHAAAYVLFYLGWEFHFRGFTQFGLRESLGDVNCILIQVLGSVLLHIGKPPTECYMSMLGGLLWGILAFRTRSLLSGLAQHAALGISLDWFLCYGGG